MPISKGHKKDAYFPEEKVKGEKLVKTLYEVSEHDGKHSSHLSESCFS